MPEEDDQEREPEAMVAGFCLGVLMCTVIIYAAIRLWYG